MGIAISVEISHSTGGIVMSPNDADWLAGPAHRGAAEAPVFPGRGFSASASGRLSPTSVPVSLAFESGLRSEAAQLSDGAGDGARQRCRTSSRDGPAVGAAALRDVDPARGARALSCRARGARSR